MKTVIAASITLLALFSIPTRADVPGAETYPVYQTKPFHMAPGNNLKFLRLFQSTGEFIKETSGKSAFVVETYTLKNADDGEYTICGSALLGMASDAKPTVFVVSHDKLYLDVGDDGWRELGCKTQGGTILKWVQRKDGTGGHDIHAFYTAAIAPSAKAPAVPPAGPLPFGVRQRIEAEYQDSLSQALGAQVKLLSDRSYKEQDGSTTSCTVGIAGGRQFRIVKSGDDDPLVNPKNAQWVAAGCKRPGYQLMR